jgi:hypothetical protein
VNEATNLRLLWGSCHQRCHGRRLYGHHCR